MKKASFFLLFLLFSPLFLFAANKSYSFHLRTKVIRHGRVFYENRLHTYQFRINIVSDNYGTKSERSLNGLNPSITVNSQERYSVVIYNPLPVRAAVNLSIDGLNAITGNPCTPASGDKWLLDPHSSTTIRGWQVNQSAMRRFFFTTRKKSYAAWRSNSWGRDLTVRCGIIAAAYFWNRSELENYFERNPIVQWPYYRGKSPMLESSAKNRRKGQKKQAFADDESKERAAQRRPQAGTGMGEKRHNPVYSVSFHYNMGMYQAAKSVRVYYDFARIYAYPRYPKYRKYDSGRGFAPEQPQ